MGAVKLLFVLAVAVGVWTVGLTWAALVALAQAAALVVGVVLFPLMVLGGLVASVVRGEWR